MSALSPKSLHGIAKRMSGYPLGRQTLVYCPSCVRARTLLIKKVAEVRPKMTEALAKSSAPITSGSKGQHAHVQRLPYSVAG